MTADDASQSESETASVRHKLIDKYGPEVDLLNLAAIGITRHAWRNDYHGQVEDAHHRISDGEMFAANVATTRLVRAYLDPHPQVRWQDLADAFTDPKRVAGQRTLVDLLGKTCHGRWAKWSGKFIAAISRVASEDGADNVLVGLADDGSYYDDWWSGPRWKTKVEAFIAQLTTDPPGISVDKLRSGLIEGPDWMDTTVLDWCTSDQLIGYTRLPQ